MRAFFFLILILQSSISSAQTYYQLTSEANSLLMAKEYKKSLEVYKRAFQIKSKAYDLYNGACAAALCLEKDEAFKLLDLALAKGEITNAKKDSDFESLHKDKRWEELVKKINDVESKYDKPLQKELLEIFEDDQVIRRKFMQAAKQFGFKSPKADSLSKVMVYSDSINLIKVRKILDKRGWVGEKQIGFQANQTLFYVIQHSDVKTQKQYLPMMKDAVAKGNASSSNLAKLEDRILLAEGKKQIYGTQIYRNEKTNQYYVAPLLDPDNVDKRRMEVELSPMAEYVKMWSITWNTEEYKKQMPELEELNKK